jgi:hypothetical protein
MSIANLLRVAQLLARHNGPGYGAIYLRANGIPLMVARYALLRKGKR